MNEETVGSLFEYPYNQYLMVRLEFLLITGDELEAKIMRIIEVEMLKQKAAWQQSYLEAIEKKQEPPKEPKQYWATMSQGLFLAFLYKFDTANVGAKHPNSLSKTSLRRAFADLTDVKNFVSVRANPENEFGPPQYTLNRPLIQEKMRLLPKHPMSLFLQGVSKLESGSFQIANSPSFQKGKSPVSKLESGEFPNCDPPNNSNLEYNQDSNSNVDTESQNNTSSNMSAPADAHTPSSSSQEQSVQQQEAPQSEKPQQKPAREKTTRATNKPAKEEEPLQELSEPDMSGAWIAEKVVQYAEWCNGGRYRETERKRQLEAARAIHKDDADLSLQQFKQAYDERNDDWWQTNQGKLHVTHMKGKEKNSGMDRVHAMLDRIAAKQKKPSPPQAKPGQATTQQPYNPVNTVAAQRKAFEEKYGKMKPATIPVKSAAQGVRQ